VIPAALVSLPHRRETQYRQKLQHAASRESSTAKAVTVRSAGARRDFLAVLTVYALRQRSKDGAM